MKCEYCGKPLRQGDTIHGMKYGTITATGFKAAQDSAVTVLCGDCGSLVNQIVYSYLELDRLKYPVILKMYTDLKASMENGYRVIQNIARLPRESQQALQHVIITCKSKRGPRHHSEHNVSLPLLPSAADPLSLGDRKDRAR